MPKVSFKQVDVFTSEQFKGNPVAVVLCAGALATHEMQQIANWTNLSETTFVVPAINPAADYRVRIFTPGGELPFAGHPTIGTAHALLEAGIVAARGGLLIQECGAGLVRVNVASEQNEQQWISFDLPSPALTPLNNRHVEELEDMLGVSVRRDVCPALIDVGPKWIVAELWDAVAVLKSTPDFARMKSHDLRNRTTGIVIFGEYPAMAEARIEVRAFAPAHGVEEDPVCGSGNGAIAALVRGSARSDRFGNGFLATQGGVLGRAGCLRVTFDEEHIQVGGMSITCIDGTISI